MIRAYVYTKKGVIEVKRAVLAILMSGLALPATARPPQAVIDANCRSHMFAGASKLGRDTVKQLRKCHSQRLNGKFPPETDCNDTINAPWAELRARNADSLRLRVYKRCEVAVASAPAALGFVGCPAPCDAVVPAISSYADVAECVVCQTLDAASGLSTAAFGTPSVPPGDEEKCFTRLGRGVRHYIGVRLKAQRACALARDRGKLPPETDCALHDPRGRVARAVGFLHKAVGACSDADLEKLDSCGATVEAERACLPNEIDSTTIEFFEAVY